MKLDAHLLEVLDNLCEATRVCQQIPSKPIRHNVKVEESACPMVARL